jgi:hypothetical protein
VGGVELLDLLFGVDERPLHALDHAVGAMLVVE